MERVISVKTNAILHPLQHPPQFVTILPPVNIVILTPSAPPAMEADTTATGITVNLIVAQAIQKIISVTTISSA